MHLTDKKATALIVLFLLPGLYLAWQQSTVWFRYESMGPLCWDGAIFLTVGRGLLNGLTPYVDLFENKPPGIFLFSALSLYLTDSHLLGSYFEASTLIIYPLAMGWLLWKLSANQPWQWYRLLLTGTAMLFGSVLAVYSLMTAGQYEAESFGAVFGMLFIVSVMRHEQMGWRNIIVSGLLLLMTVGIKEPFILTVFAALLLVCSHNLKELLPRFLQPLVVVTTVGTLIMVALGWLLPYIEIYLFSEFPLIKVGNKKKGFVDWYSGQQPDIWGRLLKNLAEVNVLPILLGMLLACALVRPFWKKGDTRQQIAGLVAIIAAIIITVYTVVMRKVVYNHQYVFIVPFYAALGLVFLKDMAISGPDKRILFVFLMAILSAITMRTDAGYANQAWLYKYDKGRVSSARKIAAHIDEVLDSCSVDRYMNVSGLIWAGHPAAFTRHSPYGPIAYQAVRYLEYNTHFRDTFVETLETAPIVIFNRYSSYRLFDLKPLFEQKLAENFTLQPPECASKVPLPEVKSNDYEIYYRKSMFGQ